MSTTISNFAEAKAAFLKLENLRQQTALTESAIREFFDRVEGGVNQFAIFRGEQPAPPPANPELFSTAPETLADRVLKIIADGGKPMKPKDVALKYRSLSWPLPDGELYKSIGASMAYLTNRKKLLTRLPAGYIPTPTPASPNLDDY